jgi:hypothetical protein
MVVDFSQPLDAAVIFRVCREHALWIGKDGRIRASVEFDLDRALKERADKESGSTDSESST